MKTVKEVEIGEWYWFFSSWHERVVMGQALKKVPDVERVVFHKVVNTDGSHAEWTPDDQASKHIQNVIKKVDQSEPEVSEKPSIKIPDEPKKELIDIQTKKI